MAVPVSRVKRFVFAILETNPIHRRNRPKCLVLLASVSRRIFRHSTRRRFPLHKAAEVVPTHGSFAEPIMIQIDGMDGLLVGIALIGAHEESAGRDVTKYKAVFLYGKAI